MGALFILYFWPPQLQGKVLGEMVQDNLKTKQEVWQKWSLCPCYSHFRMFTYLFGFFLSCIIQHSMVPTFICPKPPMFSDYFEMSVFRGSRSLPFFDFLTLVSAALRLLETDMDQIPHFFSFELLANVINLQLQPYLRI